jgi:secreted PhoX family phosphatase
VVAESQMATKGEAMALDRRSFLKGGTAAAAGLALGGPFQGFLARAAGAAPTITAPLPVPTADLRGGVMRLAVPPGFQYRSFDANPTTFADSTVPLPGNHDGMAAFGAGGNRVLLIRNHERNGSLGAFTTDAPLYDPAAPGGNTYVLVDLQGQVERTWAALAGTQMNCAGGRTPWGTWITCEETINGPDVFDDFTRNIPPNTAPDGEQTYIQNARLTKPHGYIFEVPANGEASAEPVTMAGRFAHEAAVFDPISGAIYMTEDNFGFGSGFYRYIPPVDPRAVGRIEDGGTLWMLGIVGTPQANLSGTQTPGVTYRVQWVEIPDPDPQFPMVGGLPTVTNNQAISNVGKQGWDDGAAVFSRPEGLTWDKGVVYFTATQAGGAPETVDWVNSAEPAGFGNGTGQVWAYHPQRNELEVVYQSAGVNDLNLPDNITTSPRGTLVICEDNSPPAGQQNTLQALTTSGQLIPIAHHLERPGVEFAGATFSPNSKTLYFNLNTGTAMSVAMWGPWHTLGV